jgi:hypothetical protein
MKVKRFEVRGELLERLARFAREKHLSEPAALRLILAERIPPAEESAERPTEAAA